MINVATNFTLWKTQSHTGYVFSLILWFEEVVCDKFGAFSEKIDTILINCEDFYEKLCLSLWLKAL